MHMVIFANAELESLDLNSDSGKIERDFRRLILVFQGALSGCRYSSAYGGIQTRAPSLAQKKQLFTCTCHGLTDFFAGHEIPFFVFSCCPAAIHTGICTIHLVQCFGCSVQCRQTGWYFFPQPRYRLGGKRFRTNL